MFNTKANVFLAISIQLIAGLLMAAPNKGLPINQPDDRRDAQLLQRAQRLSNDISQRLLHDGRQLMTRDLMDIVDDLERAKQTLDLATQPGRPPQPTPPPRPNPPPRPTPRPPLEKTVVRGAIETTSFDFEGYALDEIYAQCEELYTQKYNGASVDDIEVSINFKPSEKFHNASSYWKSLGEVCGIIISKAKKETDIPVSQRNRYILSGSVENKSYKIVGYDLSELNKGCEIQYNAMNVGSVDDITVSVNFDTPKILHNSSSYWRSSYEVCQQIIGSIN